MKKLFLASLILPIVILGGLFIVVSQINPNDYKKEIAAAAHEQTGGLLEINGDIEIAFFPSLEIQWGETRFTPKGEKENLIALNQVSLGLKLIPLLTGSVEIDEILIDGVEINALINEHGKANWESLSAQSDNSELNVSEQAGSSQNNETQDTSSLADNQQQGFSNLSLNISKLQISNIALLYHDKITDSSFSLKPFNLIAKNINTDGESFELEIDLEASMDDAIQVNGEIEMDISLTLEPLAMNIKDGEIELKLSGDELPWEEHKIKSEFDLVMEAKRIWLNPFSLEIDNTTFVGELGISDTNTQHLIVDLKGDKLDIDAYLNLVVPEDDSAEQQGETVSGNSNEEAESSAAEPVTQIPESTGDEELLPVETLKTLFFDVSVTLDEVIMMGMKIITVQFKASGKEGKLGVNEFSAQMYEGLLDGSVELDVTGARPEFIITENVENVQLKPMLKDAANVDMVEGVASFITRMTTEGNSVNALKKSLDGKTEFAFYKTRIENVNLEKMVCQGVALINKAELSDNWANHTEFTQMKGQVVFNNGIGDVSVQPAQLQNLKLNADGEINIPDEFYDILLTMELNGDLSKRDPACRVQENIDGAEWPIRCDGKFTDDPVGVCGLDKEGMAKILKQAARKAAVDKFKRKLKGLFGG